MLQKDRGPGTSPNITSLALFRKERENSWSFNVNTDCPQREKYLLITKAAYHMVWAEINALACSPGGGKGGGVKSRKDGCTGYWNSELPHPTPQWSRSLVFLGHVNRNAMKLAQTKIQGGWFARLLLDWNVTLDHKVLWICNWRAKLFFRKDRPRLAQCFVSSSGSRRCYEEGEANLATFYSSFPSCSSPHSQKRCVKLVRGYVPFHQPAVQEFA